MTYPKITSPSVLDEVAAEGRAIDAKWGEQNHPDGTGYWPREFEVEAAREECKAAAKYGYLTWRHVLREEVAEAFAETDPAAIRAELIQVAAVAVAWVEAIDRR